jgi:hypothetical protein
MVYVYFLCVCMCAHVTLFELQNILFYSDLHCGLSKEVRFDVLTAMEVLVVALWFVAPFSPVGGCQCFRTCCLHVQCQRVLSQGLAVLKAQAQVPWTNPSHIHHDIPCFPLQCTSLCSFPVF